MDIMSFMLGFSNTQSIILDVKSMSFMVSFSDKFSILGWMLNCD